MMTTTRIPFSLAVPAWGVVAAAAAIAAATLVLAPGGHGGGMAAEAGGDPARVSEPAGGSRAGAQRLAGAHAQRFESARGALEAGQLTEAFAALAALADEGHCSAARLALQLVHAGPQAYLTTFPAAPAQVARWRALPGCGAKAASAGRARGDQS